MMYALNILLPSVEPKATGHAQQMIDFVGVLLEKGIAYNTPSGTVYFDTSKKLDYGKLCKQKLEDLKTIAASRLTTGAGPPGWPAGVPAEGAAPGCGVVDPGAVDPGVVCADGLLRSVWVWVCARCRSICGML